MLPTIERWRLRSSDRSVRVPFSTTATRVSLIPALTMIVRAMGRKLPGAGAGPGASSEPPRTGLPGGRAVEAWSREAAHPHVLDQRDGAERRQQSRAAVADHGERDADDRQQAGHHAEVDHG